MKKILRSIYFPVFVVFVAILSAGVATSFGAFTEVKDQRQTVVMNFFDNQTRLINERIGVYEEALLFGVGIFNATELVTKQTWQEFIKASELFERYPGGQAIGYSYIFRPESFNQQLEFVKKQVGGDFRIFPESESDLRTGVVLLEPQSSRNNLVIGYDMFSEKTRREAMIAARDTGEIFISDSVELVEEDDVDNQLGFLMYAPQYADNTFPETISERQEEIRGYVYALFRAEDFIEAVLGESEKSSFEFSVYEKSKPNNVFYKSSEFDSIASKQGVNYSGIIPLDGAVWAMDITFRDADVISPSLYNRPRTILITGIIAAFLSAAITALLLRNKSNQLLLEKERGINKAKDSLLSIASHQLRTPATGVKQYLGLLLQGFVGDLSSNQTNILEKAYDSNERQLKTINDILYLARLDSGRIVIARKKMNVTEMIESVIEDMAADLHTKGHTYSFKHPKKSVYVEADEHMLRMVVENLLSNAIKYTKSGGIITIAVKSKKNEVRICIKDNGVGISKKNIDIKLFKQFSRIPNELSKSVTGTGVGLYLANNLVLKHDGEIEVTSEPGKGSEFTVVLPKNVKKLTSKNNRKD